MRPTARTPSRKRCSSTKLKKLAAALKDHLEKKKSAGSTHTAEESSLLDKAHATLARHAPRGRGPLHAISDARRTIQDLSKKEASGPLNADDSHSLAHARRAIAQQRVNDLAAAEANGTLTAPQRRQLDRFREILNASPYGTELPKGPPPGYDPHATNPAHREWYPPEGKKPDHPTADKFTPDALGIPDSEVKATTNRFKSHGHAHSRHGPEVTEGQLSDRAMYKVDPISQTKENGERPGHSHNSSRHASQFTSERAMSQALNTVENSIEYRDARAKAQAEGKNEFSVKNVSLESALGPNYQEHVRGRTREGTFAQPSGMHSTNFKDGSITAFFVKDPATGNFEPHTMYAEPSRIHEPN